MVERPDPEETIYELQLGLFVEGSNATGFVADLEGRGYRAYIVEVRSSRGEPRYTVRLGPYPTKGEAQAAAREYRNRQGGEAVIRWQPRRAGR